MLIIFILIIILKLDRNQNSFRLITQLESKLFNLVQKLYNIFFSYKMATDDPRLNKLIVQGQSGQIVILGCPFDFLRKRAIGKGGQDNGACCLRRFYPKVGPLINPQYQIDISNLKVTDYGNIRIEINKQEQQQQFKNVATKRFKGQFVNYHKQSPQKIIDKIANQILSLVKNNQLPFVFGGSKQGLMANIEAFHQFQSNNDKKTVYILSGRPFLERPFDGDKPTSDNVCSVLNIKYPQTKFKVFGPQLKYCPSQYLKINGNHLSINKQKLPNFAYITYQQIRNYELKNEDRKLGYRTQALHKFIEIFDQNQASQVNISLQVLELFNGCRDISIEGLQFDQFTQIMMFLGRQNKLRSISINEFNPSCQDYESSLIILNGLYYFLMGRAQSKTINADI